VRVIDGQIPLPKGTTPAATIPPQKSVSGLVYFQYVCSNAPGIALSPTRLGKVALIQGWLSVAPEGLAYEVEV